MGKNTVLYRKMVLVPAVAGLFVCAASANADTLEDAVLKAYENNPGLESDRALQRAVEETVVQARSQYGPNIAVTAQHEYTFTRTHVGLGIDAIEEDGFATSLELNLQQTLFSGGRIAASVNLAEARNLSQREELRGSSQDLLLEVISAYVGLRRDLELYQVAQENHQLLLQQRNLTASRLQLRDSTAPDVDQTQNRVDVAAGQVIDARAAVETSAANYRRLVGEYPDTLVAPPPLPQLASLEELYTLGETNSPEVRSAYFVELASRAQLASDRAELMPRVDSSVSLGRLPLSVYSNEQYGEQVVAGVSVSMPIYRGGLLRSQVRESVERNVAAQEFVEQRRRDMRTGLASDWNRLQSANRSLPRYAAAVASAQRAIDGVRQQETAGIRTLRDVLDVTNDLLNARTAATRAEADRYIAHARVLRDVGMLTIDIFAPRGEYDPASYARNGGAGLPLQPLLEPVDELVVFDGVEQADIEVEGDALYEGGAALVDPQPSGSQ